MMLSTPLLPEELLLANRAVDVILKELANVGFRITGASRVLDFGCGRGRIMAGWEHRAPLLYGVDTNATSIAFCRDNVASGEVWEISEPPMSLREGSIDLVYSASGLADMSFVLAGKWASELARIVRPDGILMVSFHNEGFTRKLFQGFEFMHSRPGPTDFSADSLAVLRRIR